VFLQTSLQDETSSNIFANASEADGFANNKSKQQKNIASFAILTCVMVTWPNWLSIKRVKQFGEVHITNRTVTSKQPFKQGFQHYQHLLSQYHHQ